MEDVQTLQYFRLGTSGPVSFGLLLGRGSPWTQSAVNTEGRLYIIILIDNGLL